MSDELDRKLQQLAHEQAETARAPLEWTVASERANRTPTASHARRWPAAAAAAVLIVAGVAVIALVRGDGSDTASPATLPAGPDSSNPTAPGSPDASQAVAPPAHPRLECVGDEQDFNPPDLLDISGPGAATADSALRARMEYVVEGLGTGEIVVLSDTEYGVAVDGRIVFIQRAVTNRDGDWHATDSFFCSITGTGKDLVLDDSE